MARKVLIKIRRGLEANIGALADGELGFCTDTKKLYIGSSAGNVLLVAAQTAGDMLKSIYDTDNDGVVDRADKVDWSGVENRPSKLSEFENDLGLSGVVRIVTSNEVPASPTPNMFWYSTSVAETLAGEKITVGDPPNSPNIGEFWYEVL